MQLDDDQYMKPPPQSYPALTSSSPFKDMLYTGDDQDDMEEEENADAEYGGDD